MARYKIDITEPAEDDLRDIIRYISAQLEAPITAENILDAIVSAVEGLSYMPGNKPLVSDERLASLGYRKLIVKNYIIFFTIDEINKVVNIERILYARRDWLRIL